MKGKEAERVSLEDLVGRHAQAVARCDRQAADVETAKVEAEAKEATLIADLAHGRIQEAAYESEKAANAALIGEAERALERAQAVAQSLKDECADLAERQAVEAVEEARRLRDGIAADLEQAHEQVRRLGGMLADAEDSLAAAEYQARSARAEFDPQAAAEAAQREAQEREQVVWYAREAPLREAEWPPALRTRIRDEVARLRKQHEEERSRSREQSQQSLAALGFSAQDREWMGAPRVNG